MEFLRRVAPKRFLRLGPPRNVYSLKTKIVGGLVEGDILWSEQILPSPPNRSMIHLSGLRQLDCAKWPFFWAHMGAARLVGWSWAPMNNDKEIPIESLYGEKHYKNDPSYNYLWLGKEQYIDGPSTSLQQRWGTGFYHWMTDCLPRLANLEHFPAETKIILRQPIKSWQIETLSMLQLENRIATAYSDNVYAEDYYFSSMMAMSGCVNPAGIAWLRGQFANRMSDHYSPGLRILIKRVGKTRGIANFQDVEDLLATYGFKTIIMEDLSIGDQIRLFSQAELIIAEHGGALTNLIFSAPKARVIELFGDGFLNGCYEGIAICNHLNYHYEVFTSEKDGSFSVDLRRIISLLDSHKIHLSSTQAVSNNFK